MHLQLFDKEITKVIAGYLFKAVLAVILAVVLCLILAKQIEKISASLTEGKKLLILLEQRTEITANLGKDLAIIGQADEKVDQALLPVDEIVKFVGSLESLATENSMTQVLKFGTPQASVQGLEGKPLMATDYEANLTGNALTLAGYLKKFEYISYFTGINSLQITAPAEFGWLGNSSIVVRGKVYTKGE
ncbi:MAG: hypothetical protein A3J48_00910 [Candidatus Doudnabacteria bacterium RIFCSPHIGHO2_02_FULL_46_11]|uniref:Uncharacterized protein n=1 Tax=Candidatus Doudnabacteria bacterium RIFCSPHIGHO2_02_FULL_46_11 TaxID=1817832 RepID=A0A1F5P838_9BACT|nr:MAG: hypothetical protein A3J48_00910 [Candidatus Doudnabacteria bacterium RIFCSPHIGHO2_02_FULL_46_11]